MKLGTQSVRRAVRWVTGLATGFRVAVAATSATAAPVVLEDLPRSVALPTLPANVPATIPAHERMPYVFKDTSADKTYDNSYHNVLLFPSEQERKRFEEDRSVEPVAQATSPQVCFYVAHPTGVSESEMVRGWESNGERIGQIATYQEYRRVGAVRMETFSEDAGQATLEITDFWVDVRTGGAREFGKGRLQFKEIARPYDGVILYATRTSRDQVEILVRLTESRAQKEITSTLGENVMTELFQSGYPDRALTLNSAVPARSACGHQRVRLDLEAATRDTEQPSMTGSKQKHAHLRRHPAGVRLGHVRHSIEQLAPRARVAVNVTLSALTAWEHGASEPKTRFGTLRALELRPMIINLGLSRLSGDPSPVLSVSYRWSAPPSRVHVVVPREEGASAMLLDLGN